MQIAAQAAGAALMAALNPGAVDGMMPLLFKEFDEHRWQTKLGAVQMFADLARKPSFDSFDSGALCMQPLKRCAGVLRSSALLLSRTDRHRECRTPAAPR